MTQESLPHLPAVLVASDGRHAVHAPPGIDAGVFVRDTDLAALAHRTTSNCPPDAVDMDSVAGLGSDDAAVDFLVGRLGIRTILTRRPQLAARVAARGGLGLLHVFAYDSTGMQRSLAAHPRTPGVGSLLSPGLVIVHLRPAELADLPRPIVAYGLIDGLAEAEACARLADAIIVRPGIAAKLAAVGQERVLAAD
jgi:hypothetical protein